MHTRVLFRYSQDFQGKDWADLQKGLSNSLRYLAHDGFASGWYYSGLKTVKNSDTSVQTRSGRLWAAGRIYPRTYSDGFTVLELSSYLPVEGMRKLALVIWGREIETREEQRYFVVDVNQRQVDLQSVPMVLEREGVVEIVPGNSASSPLLPAIPDGTLHFCTVTLSPSGIVDIQMITENEMPSNASDREWLDQFNRWRLRIQAQLEALTSEAMALKDAIRELGKLTELRDMAFDVARLRTIASLPSTYRRPYDADEFRDESRSATSASGYDARIYYGLLFPTAAGKTETLALLSPGDSAIAVQGGLLLPAYEHQLRFRLAESVDGDMGFSVEVTTTTTTQVEITTWTHINGWSYNQYTNWFNGAYPYHRDDFQNPRTSPPSYIYIWNKAWTNNWVLEPLVHTIAIAAEQEISGAMLAQTFMSPSSMWLTQVGVRLSQVGPSSSIGVSIHDVDETGRPIADTVQGLAEISHSNLSASGESIASFHRPIYLEGGKRYAVLLATQGSHRVATTSQRYSEGNVFAIASSGLAVADITKDLALSFYAAQFERPSTGVQLQPISLAGGIQDLAAELKALIPKGVGLELQYQLGGAWYRMDEPFDPDPLPSMLPLRLKFVGTTDLQAAIELAGSEITVSRSKIQMVHISQMRSLSGPSSDVLVNVLSYRFDDEFHSLSAALLSGGDTIAATVVTIREWEDGTTQHLFEFDLGSPIEEYQIRLTAGRSNLGVAPFTIVARQDVAN